MKKITALSESILFVLIGLITQYVVFFIAEIVLTKRMQYYSSLNKTDDLLYFQEKVVDTLGRHTIYLTLLSWIIILFVYFMIFKISKQNIIEEIKLKKIPIYIIIVCMLSGLSLNFTLNGMLSLIDINTYFPEHEILINTIIGGDFGLTLLIVGIIIPVCEELLYRGIILNRLKSHFPIYIGIIIQGSLFGISHMNIIQGIYAFILGVIFGLVVIWTDSLVSAILLHSMINSLSVILGKLGNVSLSNNYLITLILFSSILSVIGLWLLSRNRKEIESNIIVFPKG